MKPVVFLGPTMDSGTAARAFDAEFAPPARQGDVLRAVLAGAPAVGLVDGLFERVPAVWHKEILFALSEGIPVYGAASMGALRAAELSSFGMIGVGQIFEDYGSGELEDDDEVALAHGPPELGYKPLSVPMVNVRATIDAAIQRGVIPQASGERLLRIAKGIFYKDRTYERILRESTVLGGNDAGLTGFRGWLAEGAVDRKRLDALEMLERMREDAMVGYERQAPPRFVVEESDSWRRARMFVDALNRRDVPRWHFAMLADADRNRTYDQAISKVVRSGDLVLEIGTGSGLLAMMAARAGASHVYSFEQNGRLADVARRIIDRNGMSERITVIPKRSTESTVGVDLPRKADVVICEIVDHVLIGEGILHSLEHALRSLVKPGARVVPQSGRLVAAAFNCPNLHARYRLTQAEGFDLTLFNELSPCGGSTPMHLGSDRLDFLCDPVTVFEFDFALETHAAESAKVNLECGRSGLLHGVLVWFELTLIPGYVVDNCPNRPNNHWSNEVLLLSEAEPVEPGRTIELTLDHDGHRVELSLECSR